jgi:hypothetical protein
VQRDIGKNRGIKLPSSTKSRRGLRGKKRASSEKTFYRPNEITCRLRLKNQTLSLSLASFDSQPIGVVHREHQDAAPETQFGNSSRCFESAHSRHRYVEDDDVWLQSLCDLNRFLSVGGFTADFPFGS